MIILKYHEPPCREGKGGKGREGGKGQKREDGGKGGKGKKKGENREARKKDGCPGKVKL